MRAARGPADDPEPLDVERRRGRLSPHAQRREALRRTAAVDGDETHAERRRNRIVRVTREPGIAAAVQVDDRRTARVADVVDPQRATTNVVRMPS